ncbi:MAG TPA: glucose-6-phosphate dehydrogenase assembly protein OpcA [Solirubrobacteraceae bacterium]|nr:glucose-6-phosphate dehydrogenase assembly protein OpcA [Solirubrobacteraceae bacterium]
MTEDVWAAEDTTPAAIEAAVRELEMKRAAEHSGFVPARVLNLVAVVDRDWRGEIANRLDSVGRYHASRTVLCSVERDKRTLDATALLTYDREPAPGHVAVVRERLELGMGPDRVAGLKTIIDAVIISEVITVVWAPHGHDEAIDALLGLAHVVLTDSVVEPDPRAALARVAALRDSAYVVDLAWLRATPWRERVAATFDPPQWRGALGHISGVTVRHGPESAAAALLFCGWLASRLGWDPGSMIARGDVLEGRCRGRRQEVELTLTPERQDVPGLAGVTIETADGLSISLDRGPGGLVGHRVDPKGRESTWTLLGASRGEGGILGEGVRQALLRDPTYGPALDVARALVG